MREDVFLLLLLLHHTVAFHTAMLVLGIDGISHTLAYWTLLNIHPTLSVVVAVSPLKVNPVLRAEFDNICRILTTSGIPHFCCLVTV